MSPEEVALRTSRLTEVDAILQHKQDFVNVTEKKKKTKGRNQDWFLCRRADNQEVTWVPYSAEMLQSALFLEFCESHGLWKYVPEERRPEDWNQTPPAGPEPTQQLHVRERKDSRQDAARTARARIDDLDLESVDSYPEFLFENELPVLLDGTETKPAAGKTILPVPDVTTVAERPPSGRKRKASQKVQESRDVSVPVVKKSKTKARKKTK